MNHQKPIDYQERINELKWLMEQSAELQTGTEWQSYIALRIAELAKLRDRPEQTATFAIQTTVAGKVGPFRIGVVTEPTSADMERRGHVHGLTGDPMVLVRWGVGQRSWEYARDLKPIAPGS